MKPKQNEICMLENIFFIPMNFFIMFFALIFWFFWKEDVRKNEKLANHLNKLEIKDDFMNRVFCGVMNLVFLRKDVCHMRILNAYCLAGSS